MMIVVQLFLTLAMSWTNPSKCDVPCVVSFQVVSCGDADDANAGPAMVLLACLNDDENEPALEHRVVVESTTLEPGDDGRHALVKRLHVDTRKVGDIKPGGPWLGIQFGPVPKPLAAHLKLDEGVGQMVQNVIEDSPADEAGFRQYDVIVEFDGEAVPSDIGEFLGMVRGFEPGETYSAVLYREGRRSDTEVTIGTRPEDAGAPQYKYQMELAPLEDLELRGPVFGRSGLLEKDDQGNWTFKHFNLKDLPNIWHVMPDDDLNFEFHWPGAFPDANNRVVVQKSQGQSLRIERDEDGLITVTRTQEENGKDTTTTKTYADEEELENDDSDAAKLLRRNGRFGVFNKKGLSWFGGPGFKGGHGMFNLQLPELDDGQLQEKIREALRDSEEAIKHFEDSVKDKQGGAFHNAFSFGRPRTSFEVSTDGTIRVTIRKGSEELVQTFEDADAMKQARPDLHKKYKKLHGGDKK